MAITILSASFTGMNSYIVSVEVDIFNGLSGFSIVGMGDTAIIESRERIRSSLKNIDVIFPAKKVIVNLSACFYNQIFNTHFLRLIFQVPF